MGSHKLNSAIAQAYYCKQEGVTNVTTETGAGQWGASLAYAARLFGLEAAVFQVKLTYEQKPYRKGIMQTFGAQVTPSPSMSTRAGKDVLTANPHYMGSLGTAISEAVEPRTHHPWVQIHPRLGAQSRLFASDRYRPRSRKADADGRRVPRRGYRVLRWR